METIKFRGLRSSFILYVLTTLILVAILSGLTIWGCITLQKTLLPDSNQVYLTIQKSDSDGNELISWQADKAYSSVVISCSDVTKGQTYTVTGGSSSVQVTMDSLVYSESLGMGGNMSSPGNMGGQGGGPGGMKREGYL